MQVELFIFLEGTIIETGISKQKTRSRISISINAVVKLEAEFKHQGVSI